MSPDKAWAAQTFPFVLSVPNLHPGEGALTSQGKGLPALRAGQRSSGLLLGWPWARSVSDRGFRVPSSVCLKQLSSQPGPSLSLGAE